MTRYDNTKIFILDKLKRGLPENLYYHGIHHVMDVLGAAEMIGKKENIREDEMELLLVAVLFHDSGFIVSSHDHEEISCGLARESLPGFGYTPAELKIIYGMIMATKYPQQPKNLLEEIICDADLDYLGRDDFFEIGNNLFREFSIYGILSDEKEWYKLQVTFLTSHRYFTKTSKGLRDVKKSEHLARIVELIKD